MFCCKCGTQIPENGKFCPICGTAVSVNNKQPPQSNSFNLPLPSFNLKQKNLDTISITYIVLSAVMMLSMIILPMFELNYDKKNVYSMYTISLLGDNYMAGHGERSAIVTISRMTFIFLTAAIIGIVIFTLTKKSKLCLIFSISELTVLVFYSLYVHITWHNAANEYHTYTTYTCSGYTLCLLCAIATVTLSLLIFFNERKTNAKNSTPTLNFG